jgi:uncharacterized membrane protein YjdF
MVCEVSNKISVLLEVKRILKRFISWLYHKYVNRPFDYSNTSLEDYLEIHKLIFDKLQNYKINTFEKYRIVEDLCRHIYLANKQIISKK